MKSIKQSDKKAAFTIVELLTVMSIIVILIGLLVPALNQVKKFAKDVKQKAQLHAISVALEFFNGQFEAYPDSSATDVDGVPYCGAMKLAEAMVGKDLLGFNPASVFKSNGQDYKGNQLYGAGGDLSALGVSFRKLMALPPDTKVYCGHGGETTIGREKSYNFFNQQFLH